MGNAAVSGSATPPIVFGIDDSYALPLCVVLDSLAAHHSDMANTQVVVLHDSLSSDSARLIRFHAERLAISVELRSVSLRSKTYPVFGYISNAAYLRMAIPDFVPEAQVVLYLDADILVLDDLGMLLSQSLGGAPLAAVRDAEWSILGVSETLLGWKQLGLPPDREYFNSGVMLLDLAECKKYRIFERAHHFLTEHADLIEYWDQDALNWAADDHWLRLPYRWNTFAISPRIELADFHYRGGPGAPASQLVADEKNAAVLHFAGPCKPWTDEYPAGWAKNAYRHFLNSVKNSNIGTA